MNKVLLLPGDGIGPEVITQAKNVLEHLRDQHGLKIELEEALMVTIAGIAAGMRNTG